MSERVTYAILAVLCGCIGAALCIGHWGDPKGATDIIQNVATGLLGALGGWSAGKATAARPPEGNEP